MLNLLELVRKAGSVAIAGHRRPDGDCVGACLGLYNYLIRETGGNPQIDVYLEDIPESVSFLKNAEKAFGKAAEQAYDLFITLDCGSIDGLALRRLCFRERQLP